MSAKAPIEIGPCMICGRPAPLVDIRGKPIAVCVECVPLIDEVFHPIAERVRAVSKPAKAVAKAIEAKPKITPEELKNKLVEVVEKQGKASLRYASKQYRVGLKAVREIAQALVDEKGYTITKDEKGNMYLERAAPAQH